MCAEDEGLAEEVLVCEAEDVEEVAVPATYPTRNLAREGMP
jgi:hypothetical protein